jgi:hypothetical protein
MNLAIAAETVLWSHQSGANYNSTMQLCTVH